MGLPRRVRERWRRRGQAPSTGYAAASSEHDTALLFAAVDRGEGGGNTSNTFTSRWMAAPMGVQQPLTGSALCCWLPVLCAGELMSESHTSCRDDYACSATDLDELVALCQANGAYGARYVRVLSRGVWAQRWCYV